MEKIKKRRSRREDQEERMKERQTVSRVDVSDGDEKAWSKELKKFLETELAVHKVVHTHLFCGEWIQQAQTLKHQTPWSRRRRRRRREGERKDGER